MFQPCCCNTTLVCPRLCFVPVGMSNADLKIQHRNAEDVLIKGTKAALKNNECAEIEHDQSIPLI